MCPKRVLCSPEYPFPVLLGKGEHKHLCGQCGTCWRHGNDNQSDETAHTCPGCSNVVWGRWWTLDDAHEIKRTVNTLRTLDLVDA